MKEGATSGNQFQNLKKQVGKETFPKGGGEKEQSEIGGGKEKGIPGNNGERRKEGV